MLKVSIGCYFFLPKKPEKRGPSVFLPIKHLILSLLSGIQ
jgi:hypothetical protein